ncbi:MAG TPA: glycosyltransferase family 4 protein [Clostridia bacterium]|nr:glycosyltransferase family 4 protein [Clostridia bacterium]
MASDLKPRVAQLIRLAEGGMKHHYISLIQGLLDSGIQVVALCNFPPKDMEGLEGFGATPLRFSMHSENHPLRDIHTVIRLVNILKEYRIDVLHCHGFRAGLIGRIAAFLARCNCIYTMHNFPPLGLSKGKRQIAGNIERYLSHITGKIITVSEALKREAVDSMAIKEDKIGVIYNGISRPAGNKTLKKLRESLGIDNDQVLIGTVARLIPSKGIDVLLDAIPFVNGKYPNVKFIILGDGPEESKLRGQAIKLNCNENIIFAGYKEYIWYYYDVFDIFLLPTLSEGLGISIIEALMVGLPVISTRTGGVEEIIRHNYNGYLVPPGNSKELARAILYFLAHPEKAKEYGRRGKELVKDKFHKETMIRETLDLILDVME